MGRCGGGGGRQGYVVEEEECAPQKRLLQARKRWEMGAVQGAGNKSCKRFCRRSFRPRSEHPNAAVGLPQRHRHTRRRYCRLEISPCRHFIVACIEQRSRSYGAGSRGKRLSWSPPVPLQGALEEV